MDERLRRFYARLFERNEIEGRKLLIRDFGKFDAFVDRVGPLGGSQYNSMVSPGAIISFDHRGSFSTFCPELLLGHGRKVENPFVFGNVRDHQLRSIIDDANYSVAAPAVASGREKCRDSCP
jgi:hypothetical protein